MKPRWARTQPLRDSVQCWVAADMGEIFARAKGADTLSHIASTDLMLAVAALTQPKVKEVGDHHEDTAHER
jgi:hypothetical protein